MSDTNGQFETSPDGDAILYARKFETLATGETREIIEMQNVSKGTYTYYQNGLVYTPTGTVSDSPIRKVVGTQQLTLTTVVTALTVPALAKSAMIYVYNAGAIFMLDTTSPVVGTTGVTVTANNIINIESRDELLGFRGRRTGGANSTLSITYYNTTSAVYGEE